MAITRARPMDIPMVLTKASNLMYFLVSSCTKPQPDTKMLRRASQPVYFFNNPRVIILTAFV